MGETGWTGTTGPTGAVIIYAINFDGGDAFINYQFGPAFDCGSAE
jgi:hypothetical protein